MEYLLGVDFGQRADYTALALLYRHTWLTKTAFGLKKNIDYQVTHLERPQLGTPYPVIVNRIRAILSDKRLAECEVVVDSTGVGVALNDQLEAVGILPVSITIHGGNNVLADQDHRRYSVPKRDLVTSLVVHFEQGRLSIAEGMELTPVLSNELQSFGYKIDPKTGHDSYESVREGEHDDIVLAVACALWYGSRNDKHEMQEDVFIESPTADGSGDYDPLTWGLK